MRISELAADTGVSVATLKYYLREGLVQPGASLGATRADYDESHVARVRLVRTLVEVGRLSIGRVREVVAALEAPPTSRHDLLGTAHDVLRSGDDQPGDRSAVDALVERLGWHIAPDSPAARQLALSLERAAANSWTVAPEHLLAWAGAARVVAETDVTGDLAERTAAAALEFAILGNVLTDPVVIGLRHLAQEAVSADALGP